PFYWAKHLGEDLYGWMVHDDRRDRLRFHVANLQALDGDLRNRTKQTEPGAGILADDTGFFTYLAAQKRYRSAGIENDAIRAFAIDLDLNDDVLGQEQIKGHDDRLGRRPL